MKCLWRLRDMPELEHLPPVARRALLRSSVGWMTRAKMILLAMFIGTCSWGLAYVTLSSRFSDAFSLAAALIGGVVVSLLTHQLVIAGIRSRLRAEVADLCRGERPPMCLSCGYDLTGAVGNVCPECGAGIVGGE